MKLLVILSSDLRSYRPDWALAGVKATFILRSSWRSYQSSWVLLCDGISHTELWLAKLSVILSFGWRNYQSHWALAGEAIGHTELWRAELSVITSSGRQINQSQWALSHSQPWRNMCSSVTSPSSLKTRSGWRTPRIGGSSSGARCRSRPDSCSRWEEANTSLT